MNGKRVRLALTVAVSALAGGMIAAASSAATPTLTTHLFAKAGPVKMHADLSFTTAPAAAAAKVSGSLSSCQVQPSKPRSGVADKIVCTTPSGAKVSIPLAPAAATLTYHLTAAGSASLQSATVQIRHKTTVLATLSASGGTVTLPLDHAAGLINGHDTLYVQLAAHTYSGKITRIH